MTSRFASFPGPLYAILDPEPAAERPLLCVLEELLSGGARLIQLRVKKASSKEFYRWALEGRRVARAKGCLFVVNDRVDIALAVDADGVHLGQEDLPLSAARRLMGEKIIGVSTHDPEQALQAERGGADYIGFGPIFGTSTKDTGYSPRGLEMLKAIRRTVRIPIVAIGGITESNVAGVWKAGAGAAAMIGDLMGAADVAGKVRRILRQRP
jgi:thiamine-phosphate pyrophosphorylase